MVALSLDALSVKGKFKDFVLQVLGARDEALDVSGAKKAERHRGKTPRLVQGLSSPLTKGSNAPFGGLVEAYSKIRNFEVQLACVMTQLSARIVPTITAEHVLARVNNATSASYGNTAQ